MLSSPVITVAFPEHLALFQRIPKPRIPKPERVSEGGGEQAH